MLTESHRIEFKSQLTDNLEKEAVAFLNDRDGGLIYIGVNKADVRAGLIDPAFASSGWESSCHFNVIVLRYTQMYKFPFQSANTLFILRTNMPAMPLIEAQIGGFFMPGF